MFPAGRARLATRPEKTASPVPAMTIGIVVVDCLAARAPDLVLLVVGLLTATAACALVTELRRPSAVRPAPTVAGPPASELVQVSAPPTSSAPATETRPAAAIRPTTPAAAAAPASAPPSAEPQEQPRTTAPERQSNDADDPRAVIDWLLNRSSVRGQ